MHSPFHTAQTEDFKKRISHFLEKEIYPLELEIISKPFSSSQKILDELRKQMKKKGFWNLHLSKEQGGPGLSLTEFGQISEVLGRSPLGHFLCNCQAPDAGNMELLWHAANAQQKEAYLQPLLNGDIRSCFAMTEPGQAGSNPTLLSTTANLKNGVYTLQGRKWFTTGADGARFAIVMAVTHPEDENPYQRASMLLVPTDTPGYRHVRNIPIMGDAGDGYLSHAEIAFENCQVPESHLLGGAQEGFALAQTRLGPGRIHHCMRWIGICERAFDMMCTRLKERTISKDKQLADLQALQFWVAELRAQIQAARLMVLHTAYGIEQAGAKAVKEDISTIKFFVANVLMEVLDKAIQVHGALGITDDTLLSFWYRHERGARIYDGPDEVHKSALAKKILKNYA